jgi:hypothetical protein
LWRWIRGAFLVRTYQEAFVVDPLKLDQLLTFRQAAEELGVPAFKFRRAAKCGLIPTYSIYNSRKYVKLRDILAIIEASKTPVV